MPPLPFQETEERPPSAQLSRHPQSALCQRVELRPVDPVAQFAPHEQLSLLMPYRQNLHSSGFHSFFITTQEPFANPIASITETQRYSMATFRPSIIAGFARERGRHEPTDTP